MKILRVIPCFMSSLLLAAHFYRAGLIPIALVALCITLLLTIKKTMAVRLAQVLLVLGSLEWLRTLYILAIQRQELHQPWLRLAIILGIVSLITGLSALPLSGFHSKKA